MIRKPVFPRIMGLLALYGGVFFILVIIQFTKQGNFTQRIGRATVSGQYRTAADAPENSGAVPLEGGVSVFFGGLEFRLRDGSAGDDFVLIDRNGRRQPAEPEWMTASGDAAVFRLPGGTEIAFTTQYAGASAELRISGDFAGGAAGVDIPIRALRSSRIREGGDGKLTVTAEGINYVFGPLEERAAGALIPLRAGGAPVVYRAAPEKKAFDPAEYILPQAASSRTYNDYIVRWRDQHFSLWNQIVPGQNDEDMVIAYSGEAVRRGAYKAAVSAASPAFLEGSRRTYESSVYLGNMSSALQSFAALEREKISRLSRQINERSPDFLREPQVFEYFAVRAYGSFIDDGVAIVRALDPAGLSLGLTPGIFEGWLDLKQYRAHGDNPFDRLIDQACYIVSEDIGKAGEIRRSPGGAAVPAAGNRVFAFREDSADMEFNLRLGRALWRWAESAGRSDWAALGRSLIVSVLSLADGAGTVPRSLLVSAAGEIQEAPAPRISSARLYRILTPGEYHPRSAPIGSGVNGIWAWTAVSALGAAQENNVLDISVSFP
ncbi:MAG: hypothetical protein LBK02_08565, partial [Treponema sp.]|nr:hypothetical protein [Treponema sp.]